MAITSTSFKAGVSGNPNGRKKGTKNEFSIEALHKAIRNVQKREKVKVFEHFVEMSLVDNKVLIALMKKLLPDMIFREPVEPFPYLDEEIEIPIKNAESRFKAFLN